MKNQAISRERIIAYYDQSEIDYRMVLHLDQCLALHFGYWDETTHSLRAALARENQVLAELARPDAASAVLDAGCGVGGSAIFLAKAYGCKVTGITLSARQVTVAGRNAERHGVAALTSFQERDFCNTGFEGQSFDIVWAIESVCHAENKADFVREAYRVLKPGGRLVLADGFCAKEDYAPAEQAMMEKWLAGWGANSLETPGQFQALLAEAGFKNIAFNDVTRNVYPTSKRLYWASFPGMFFGKILEWLGLRTSLQTGNVIAARYQHLCLRKNLWRYGMVFAEK